MSLLQGRGVGLQQGGSVCEVIMRSQAPVSMQ